MQNIAYADHIVCGFACIYAKIPAERVGSKKKHAGDLHEYFDASPSGFVWGGNENSACANQAYENAPQLHADVEHGSNCHHYPPALPTSETCLPFCVS